jgi:hypothetical protein
MIRDFITDCSVIINWNYAVKPDVLKAVFNSFNFAGFLRIY